MRDTLPELPSDTEAERFIAETDLTKFYLGAFQPHRFEYGADSEAALLTRVQKRQQ